MNANAPTLLAAGWHLQTQIREKVSFTKGRIIVRGKLHHRAKESGLTTFCLASPISRLP